MTVAYIYFLNKISLYFGGHAGLNKGIKEIRPHYSISAKCGERSFVKNGRKERERAFQKNGGMLLEKLVATCNGKPPIPIRNFSEKDLISATSNYDPLLALHDDGCWK